MTGNRVQDHFTLKKAGLVCALCARLVMILNKHRYTKTVKILKCFQNISDPRFLLIIL